MAQKYTNKEIETRAAKSEEAGFEQNRTGQTLESGEKFKIRNDFSTSVAQYRDLVETIPYGIQEVSLEGRILFCNNSYHRMLGYENGTLMGTFIWDHASNPESAEKLNSYFKHLIKEHPEPKLYLDQKVCADGKIIDCQVDWNYKYSTGGGIEGFIAVITDVTEKLKARKAIEDSEVKYRTLFEMESDAIFLIDKETGQILEVNTAASKLYGYTRAELLEMKNTDLSAEPEKTQRATHDKLLNIPVRHHRKKTGEILPVEITASHLNWKGKDAHIAAIRDISLRIEHEKEKEGLYRHLSHAKKMESIGTLAGGIAHDFNNLLMGIQGRTSLMSVDMGLSHPHAEHIHAIEEYIRSATDLTRQLLGFARRGKYEVRAIDVNEMLLNSAAMFGRTRKEIKINTKVQGQPLVVEADRRQIEQVLLNMYVNAWQAMPAGGELSLETDSVTLDDEDCKPHQIEPGRYCRISISDTGIGMDEPTVRLIFDPFFSTKGKSLGSGLGLASAYGIIRNHGGMIRVCSDTGHGTTFTIYLPVSEKEVYRETRAQERLVMGSETVLLVDDERMILEVSQALLEKLGYRVIIASGGEQAVDAVTEMGHQIDFVILDLIMPGVDGGKAFDLIREIRPDLPVILSSGYAINGHANQILQRGCNGFIQKPFNIFDLSKKIRSVLDR